MSKLINPPLNMGTSDVLEIIVEGRKLNAEAEWESVTVVGLRD